MPQINLRVGEEQKQRWKETAKEDERTLTSFIQHCVETHPDYNEFQQQHMGSGSGLPPETAETINRMASQMDQLSESIESVDSRTQAIESSLQVEQQSVEQTAERILDRLPTVDYYEPEGGMATKVDGFGTVGHIANEIEESERQVATALEWLQEQHMVYSRTIDGQERYWRD